jgi:hypothetical protein
MRRSLSFAAFAIGAAFAGALAGAAQAHSPYLLPSTFDVTDRKLVTVQGSFTESFFSPEVVMKSDAWAVVGPDGARTPLTATNLRELALVEVTTDKPGTYRVTTGQRTGRTAKAVLVKGEWEFIEDPSKAPGRYDPGRHAEPDPGRRLRHTRRAQRDGPGPGRQGPGVRGRHPSQQHLHRPGRQVRGAVRRQAREGPGRSPCTPATTATPTPRPRRSP